MRWASSKSSARAGRNESGFTLVELLVSLLIFGMLSAAGVALLSVGIQAQDAAGARLEELAEVRRAGAILSADLAQIAPRLSRDREGRLRPAFAGGAAAEAGAFMLFVRRGWENAAGSARPSLQKVAYRLAEGRLQRIAWPQVDGAEALAPVTLVDGVSGVAVRYRDERGEWRERWDPEEAGALPVAVELSIDAEGAGSIRQLFVAGTGA